VDFKGTSDELVRAGLALPTWFKNRRAGARVDVEGRTVELYLLSPDSVTRSLDRYELSILYTNEELGRAGGKRSHDAAKRISSGEKISKALRARWTDPEYRARVCASMREAWRRRKAGSARA
jgi:hypothetical protein